MLGIICRPTGYRFLIWLLIANYCKPSLASPSQLTVVHTSPYRGCWRYECAVESIKFVSGMPSPPLVGRQISTSDGRVRITGKDGVERTLRTANGFIPEPTKQLMFLLNRGVIIRLDQVRSSGRNLQLSSIALY
jgi:hypothetical protein